MKKKWKIAVGFVLGGLLTAVCLHPPITSQDWAAWVQAVGSIAAIAGSFALARVQANESDRIRKIEKLESNYAVAKMAVRLAIDTVFCLDNTAGKIDSRILRPRHIGQERLDQLQTSLHSFASKNIPEEILSELLVLQREIAFTLMAIREIGARRPNAIRAEKAYKRTNRVIRSQENLRKIEQLYRSELLRAKA